MNAMYFLRIGGLHVCRAKALTILKDERQENPIVA
jgi:hypothetical protein